MRACTQYYCARLFLLCLRPLLLLLKNLSVPFITYQVARRAPNHFPLVSSLKRSRLFFVVVLLSFFFCFHSIHGFFYLCLSVCVVWYIDMCVCVYRKNETSRCTYVEMYRAEGSKQAINQAINQSTLLYMPAYHLEQIRTTFICVGISICLPKQ